MSGAAARTGVESRKKKKKEEILKILEGFKNQNRTNSNGRQ